MDDPARYVKRILVVDDNVYIRALTRTFLEVHPDFQVCGEAVNGREAIEKTQELRPDLIVLDLAMPVMNGLDAAREIKRTMPAIPIILFTLYEDTDVRAAADDVGVKAVVTKTDTEALMRHVRSLLSLSQRAASNQAN